MPFCPSCGAAFRSGLNCPTCDVPLGEAPPESLPSAQAVEWIAIYKGRGVPVRSLEAGLRHHGFSVVLLPDEQTGYPQVQPHSGSELQFYRVAIPEDQYHARRGEVDGLLAALGSHAEDPVAILEAEEDYDVRACPECLLFFHENYDACPGCGSTLVAAVECFEAGQAEPDRVIVGHGTVSTVKQLESQLKEGGFDAQAFEVEGWSVDVVDLPWGELTDRTGEAEEILGLRTPSLGK